MALLHYENLVEHRPDMLMTKAFYGLKSHNDYLTRVMSYMVSDEAVLRLAVERGFLPESHHQDDGKKANNYSGVWVQLTEPEDLPNLPEKVFDDFLKDNVKSVYETGPAEPDTQSNKRKERRKFFREREIRVLNRDVETEQLLLERMPVGEILLRPNTYTVQKQLEAIRRLQNAPSPAHLPLLRLLEDTSHARWPDLNPDFETKFFKTDYDIESLIETTVPDPDGLEKGLEWKVLTDATRPGTTEQRLFVATALNTPDFSLLEGPPGSGKTTAICELILQLVQKGQRVLLCASTHVAVDNVIERLMEDGSPHRHLVIPVRIGDEANVSEKTWCWQLGQFVKTESKRIKAHLDNQHPLTESQSALKQNIQNDSSLIERMVLDSANLVCGTTIGLLQHPDIKQSRGVGSPQFDIMIIDEASKTTFHEFLVPALHAKRWILVGDPKQLSPYVDDEDMAINLKPCLNKEVIRNACVDVFLASQRSPKKRRTAIVELVSPDDTDVYEKQAAAHSVSLKRVHPEPTTGYASIVIGDRESLQRCEDYLPLDSTTIRSAKDESFLPVAERRAIAYARRNDLKIDGSPAWEKEVAWRQARLYEQRFAPEKADAETRKNTVEKLTQDLAALLPTEAIEGVNPAEVRDSIESVRRVALPVASRMII